jgi:hypothetical protein
MFALLENEFNAELQLPHSNRGTGRGIRLDVSDLTRAGCAKAIDTLVARQSQHGMVKQVVRIKAELRFEALRDVEIFRQRHVIVEGMGASIRIESEIPDLAASRKRKRTGCRSHHCARVRSNLTRRQVVVKRSHG